MPNSLPFPVDKEVQWSTTPSVLQHEINGEVESFHIVDPSKAQFEEIYQFLVNELGPANESGYWTASLFVEFSVNYGYDLNTHQIENGSIYSGRGQYHVYFSNLRDDMVVMLRLKFAHWFQEA